MKQYVIDQLRESDYERIRDFLNESAEKTALEDLYRVELPENLYSPVQAEHGSCRPYYFAVSLDRNQVAFELLVRSREVIRCNCIAYALPVQRDYIIGYADRMLDLLEIKL
ncbi:MAG: hypothetical protein LLF99_08735 [Desulfobacteraceae bacterium]|nr:hypothetical protein [Desulfobacteraceae bacterium]